jgi:hypothetical protein
MNAPLRINYKRRSITVAGRSVACDERWRPYRQLAIRVLARAVLDVTNPAGSANDRETARAFLAGSAMLEHWCHVAAVDPLCIAANVDRLTRDSATMPQRFLTSRRDGQSGSL